MSKSSFNNIPEKDLQLSRFTIENLQEAVFWIDSNGCICQVNERASRMSGYSKDELLQKKVSDMNPSEVVADFPAFWKRLKNEKTITFQAKHKHKDGHLYDVEITGNYIEYNGQGFSCSIVHDISKRKADEELLHSFSGVISPLTGTDFLVELCKKFTKALNMPYAVIAECIPDEETKVRTLCFINNDAVIENIEYDVSGLPCEVILQGKQLFVPENAYKQFPADEGIEAATGVPIYSNVSGKIIGHIIISSPHAVTESSNRLSILKIFAARAGAEIERIEAQRKLEKANEELAIRLKEIETLRNQLAAENKYLQEEIKLTYNFEEIISKSKNFQKVLQQIEQVAATDATVLILGESGTGKELIARAVHNISNRSKRPLVKVNCATLPANLIESELFGHEKGAFTGAMDKKIGRFELADNTTIFLDEIGELPVELQAKLLRVLQEGEFERLGNPRTMKVNVRVIAATNRNLEQAIEKKEFREDLYYRLNVFPIFCPPLRERKEDIPLLIKHFCQKHEAKIGKKITNIPAKVMDELLQYDWPGNIRELENIIERALILSKNNTLEYGEWMPAEKKTSAVSTVQRLEDIEKEHILSVLKKTGWKVSGDKGAGKILGLNATTLEAKMKKLGIKREA
jgi:formate hydrogenlyase transcriptional activator